MREHWPNYDAGPRPSSTVLAQGRAAVETPVFIRFPGSARPAKHTKVPENSSRDKLICSGEQAAIGNTSDAAQRSTSDPHSFRVPTYSRLARRRISECQGL